jgi:hypothetical protein
MIVEQMVECEFARETEILGENFALVSLCPPQIPHYPTRARNRTATVRSRPLTAWAKPGLIICITAVYTSQKKFSSITKNYVLIMFRKIISTFSAIIIRSILPRDGVTRRVLYWRPDLLNSWIHNAWLHFTLRYETHKLVSTVTSPIAVAC